MFLKYSTNARGQVVNLGLNSTTWKGMGCSLGGRQVHPGKGRKELQRLQLLNVQSGGHGFSH